LRLGLSVLASRLRGGPRPAALVRLTLQKLGMTGLKFGQFLALRSDLFSPEVCEELGKLFESVAPMEFATVRAVIEADLGEPFEVLFSEFETVSIAAASIAQVHLARNRDGHRVAVKVQRPNLEKRFHADMRIMLRLVAIVDALGVMGELKLVDAVGEFAKYTSRELDFVIEGQTADRLREAAKCGEIVPWIYWGLSSRRVLTMEFIEGISMAKAGSLLAAGNEIELRRLLPDLDLPLALHNLTRASLHQLYVTGFFHADPHPGNILLCPGNRIAFLDFGIFGEVSPMQKEVLARYLEELVYGNLDQCVRFYARVYTPTERTDIGAFQREAKSVLHQWYEIVKSPGGSSQDRLVARFSDEMLTVVRHHYLRITVDTLLFWRALVVLDASILQLWSGFDLVGELRGFFAEFRPGIIDRTVEILTPETHLASLVRLVTESAGRLDEVMSEIASGRFEATVTLKESPATRQRENRRIRTYVLALLGASVMLLGRVFTAPVSRDAVWATALVCFVLSLIRWKK
jgi:ubiquinone biosynthesis protein